ncbi:DUF6748 domain-containing protein [Sorangium sp. So ce1036]|uniref:DUF6748 domain-containing protein n=1 Tax=Sorangium sp. So ce1036 TaxID=3133328 RepID=UPI003F0C4654
MFDSTHHRISRLALLGSLTLPALACDVPGDGALALDEPQTEPAAEVDPGALIEAKGAVADYFIVTRPDLRKCVSPICGGHFVARVNTSVARCADGTWQEECHMFELDLSRLRLDRSTVTKVKEAFGAGKALVRGELGQAKTDPLWPRPADVLIASEVWIGATGKAPEGHFSRVESTGIVCITYPCPSFSEKSLNTSVSGPLDSIDLSASGATPERVEGGFEALAAGGLLVAGHHTVITGPAGSMNGLEAVEFYLPVR